LENLVQALEENHDIPFYLPLGDECALFKATQENQLPLMLKGPTGCGKSRLVEHMAATLDRSLVTVSCHEDTSATDLLGRWLIRGGETVWQDGPVSRAVRDNSILYLDEVIEARSDVLVVIHALSDHRRRLFLERHDEVLQAKPEFMLVISFNPGYTRGLKELKPSTRQRFVAIDMVWPDSQNELKILEGETGIDQNTGKKLCTLAQKLRSLDEMGLAESASTRLLVHAARLISAGMSPRLACRQAIVSPLTDEDDIQQAVMQLVNLLF
jgi:nitric oxide reductase NorQ protein